MCVKQQYADDVSLHLHATETETTRQASSGRAYLSSLSKQGPPFREKY